MFNNCHHFFKLYVHLYSNIIESTLIYLTFVLLFNHVPDDNQTNVTQNVGNLFLFQNNYEQRTKIESGLSLPLYSRSEADCHYHLLLSIQNKTCTSSCKLEMKYINIIGGKITFIQVLNFYSSNRVSYPKGNNGNSLSLLSVIQLSLWNNTAS